MNVILICKVCFFFHLENVKVESLRAKVAQKDMFISELLDRIAIVDCEVRLDCDHTVHFPNIMNVGVVFKTLTLWMHSCPAFSYDSDRQSVCCPLT